MANLTPINAFSDTYQYELTDDVIGGPGGMANSQAQSNLNRTEWLRRRGSADVNLGNSAPTTTLTLQADLNKRYFSEILAFQSIEVILPPVAQWQDGDFIVIANDSNYNPTNTTADYSQIKVTGTVTNPILNGGKDAVSIYIGNGESVVIMKYAGETFFRIIQRFSADASPVGSIHIFPKETASGFSIARKRGFIKCDGSTLNNLLFSRLFAVIGYSWGGTGASFGIPNIPNDSKGANIEFEYFIKY